MVVGLGLQSKLGIEIGKPTFGKQVGILYDT